MTAARAVGLLECRLGAALAISLGIHVVALSLAPPAPRVALFVPPPVLEVVLRELAAPPAVTPEPAWITPPAPLAAPRSAPAARQRVVAPLAPVDEPPLAAKAPEAPIEALSPALPEPALAAPVSPPAPLAVLAPPPAPTLSPEHLVRYGQTISAALARYREYPRLAQLRGWQGVVTMRLRIAPSGRLLDAEVHTSSGHEVLDRQAVAMAWMPERLPPLPDGVSDQEVAVLVPIVFRLAR